MSNVLYTAPDCIRCKIVKSFFAAKNINYSILDLKEDAEVFANFYRENRAHIYRNPEGVEFPLFSDGQLIKQGSAEIIAYFLSGQALATSSTITRSDLLHGWISGLYLSCCPDAYEDAFVEILQQLAAGGLQICLQTDGRKAEFLQSLLALEGINKVQLNILGSEKMYERVYGQSLGKDDLAKSIELVRGASCGEIRFLAQPIKRDGLFAWPTRADAADAANMLFASCNDHQLPITITQVCATMPQGLQGLEPIPDAMMLKYRSAMREFLFKANIEAE